MTSRSLPNEAFVPRNANAREKQEFVVHRNRLFDRCTPEEQQCLAELARWHATVRLELFAKPNLFSESYMAWFNHRYLLYVHPKPRLNPIIVGLAKIHGLICAMESRLSRRAIAGLIVKMRGLAGLGRTDVLITVIHVVRLLPLSFGNYTDNVLKDQLDALMRECLETHRISATARFDAVLRCLTLSNEIDGVGADDFGMRQHAWPLLLEVARENLQAAVRLVDTHWNQNQPPEVLMTLQLHEKSELAYQLAVTLKPHRPEFAADMLRALIFDASFQVKKLEEAAATALSKISEASCQLLAQWTFEETPVSPKCALQTIERLLQFGDPAADYWSKLAPEALRIIQSLEPKQQAEQLRLLAQVTFYGESPSLVSAAHGLFKSCVARTLSEPGDWEWSGRSAVSNVSRSLSLLENKAMSFRNRFIAARPDHPLLHTLEAEIETLLKRMLATQPASALSHIVALTLALTNEVLVRKHHEILRTEFSMRAGLHPADAGLALRQLIQYCGYSQVDDEMYRKELCQESFDMLLPLLQSISPADANVARTGIGWSARPADI